MLQGCGEKGTLIHCWHQCKLVQPLWKNRMEASQKNKTKQNNEPPYEPEIPLLDRYPPQTKNINAKRHMHPNVHRSIVYNCWHTEATYVSVNRWMEKAWHTYTYTYNGILLSLKKSEILPFAATWIDLEDITQSEIRKKKANTV